MSKNSARQRRPAWDPASWVSVMPNGIGQVKPNHYLDMLKTIWANRDQLPYTWRILSQGVCDGCALGTSGLKDWTMPGPHLCTVRLNLLRLNTMPAFDIELLKDVESLKKITSKELRDLGRLPYPMLRRKGEAGFHRIEWNEALNIAADKIRSLRDPDRMAFYLTARGLTNEVYYAAQKAVRFLGTNNIDNAARICHSPSTYALKEMLGISCSSCSYSDWIGSDLLVFIGSDVPNNQPVTTKYMYYAKKAGAKIIVVNPLREPGLERYWIPSAMESALFGTKIADEFFPVHTGGDRAFFAGALKALLHAGKHDHSFIENHSIGFDEVKASVEAETWDNLVSESGASREQIEHFAAIVGQAKTGVFIWSMGITQHVHGVDNVRSMLNLALARGFIGREKCGVMPIRGHSGVQGSAEMGAYATSFPNNTKITPESAEEFGKLWKFTPPHSPGLTAADMIHAAHREELDLLYCVGGNFLETLPDPKYVEEALKLVPMRVHQDIVLTSQMLTEPNEMVLLLPAATRYEQPGGGTETTTERRVIFSPEIRGRRIGEARSEWEILMKLAETVYPDRADHIHFEHADEIRKEIAFANPHYDGIQNLKKQGDQFQWGGQRLCENYKFETPDGKARFVKTLSPPDLKPPGEGKFRVSTRRGKQFNSMVQAQRDPLTGAYRDAVFISPEDAKSMALSEGDPVLLRNDIGELKCRIKIAPLRPRNLQIHWPEGNVLLHHSASDPIARVPDYNAEVEIVKLQCDPAT